MKLPKNEAMLIQLNLCSALHNKSKAILTGLQRISKASVTDPSKEAGNKSPQVC